MTNLRAFIARHVHDPGQLSLRKGARAALVTPLLFALGSQVIDDQNVALFAAFGSFAALVFADFSGPLGRRAAAYASFTVAGLGLVALGTVLSTSLLPAAVTMLVVGFVLLFTTVLGGYPAAASTPLVLAFVLSVMVPAGTNAIAPRLAGWALGGAAATVAAVLLWPARPRLDIARRAAALCRELSTTIAACASDTPSGADTSAVVTALDDLRAQSATAQRPLGPTRRDASLLRVIDQLGRAVGFVEHLCVSPVHDVDRGLLRAAAGAFDRSAAQLDLGRAPAPDDLLELDRARSAHRQLLQDQAGAVLTAGDADRVLDRVDRTFDARSLSYLALSLEANTAVLGGAPVDDEGTLDELDTAPDVAGSRPLIDWIRRGLTIALAELDPGGVALRNSLRGAVALAAAVVIADAAHLDHAFWVVLGALSVLRSNAGGTGASAIEAVIGTLCGFAISAAFVVATGGGDSALWIMLPVAVFLSGYTPTAVRFGVGQASFTLFVVVLFDLVEPAGIETGEVRVEAVMIGAATSVVVALLFWPRGARGVLCRSIAELYTAAGGELTQLVAFEHGDRPVDHRPLLTANRRTDTAFLALLNEHGGSRVGADTWASLIAPPSLVRTATTLLAATTSGLPADPRCDAADAELGAWSDDVAGDFTNLAETLSGGSAPTETFDLARLDARDREHHERLHRALIECLRPAGADDSTTTRALCLAWAGDWLHVASLSLAGLAEPLAAIEEAQGRPWWR